MSCSFEQPDRQPDVIPLDPVILNHLKDISDSPALPINSKEIHHTAKILVKSSLITTLSNLAIVITSQASIGFIGRYGSPTELAAASLIITWSLVFYLGVFISVNAGFQVVASELYGANKRFELGQTFQKALLLILILSGPLLIFFLCIGKVLAIFDFDEEVIIKSYQYLLYSIPSLIMSCYIDCIRCFLVAQNHFFFQGVIQGIATGFHFVWCYVFVVSFNLSLTGTAIANTITDIIILLSFYLYMKFRGITKQLHLTWDKSWLKGFKKYCKNVSAIGANVYIQFAFEGLFGLAVSGLKNDNVIGAQGLGSMLATVLFTLSEGNNIAMQAYLGNAVGGGWKNKAQKIVFAAFSLNLLFGTINTSILVFGNEFIASLMTNDPVTKEIFKNMMYLYAAAHLADTFADHISSVLRIMGQAKYVVAGSLICYFIIGVPMQWTLGYATGAGYIGLWVSAGIQTYLVFGWMLRRFINLNWEKETRKIKEQIEEGHRNKKTYVEMN